MNSKLGENAFFRLDLLRLLRGLAYVGGEIGGGMIIK